MGQHRLGGDGGPAVNPRVRYQPPPPLPGDRSELRQHQPSSGESASQLISQPTQSRGRGSAHTPGRPLAEARGKRSRPGPKPKPTPCPPRLAATEHSARPFVFPQTGGERCLCA